MILPNLSWMNMKSDPTIDQCLQQKHQMSISVIAQINLPLTQIRNRKNKILLTTAIISKKSLMEKQVEAKFKAEIKVEIRVMQVKDSLVDHLHISDSLSLSQKSKISQIARNGLLQSLNNPILM